MKIVRWTWITVMAPAQSEVSKISLKKVIAQETLLHQPKKEKLLSPSIQKRKSISSSDLMA